jgi:hypothetical protein
MSELKTTAPLWGGQAVLRVGGREFGWREAFQGDLTLTAESQDLLLLAVEVSIRPASGFEDDRWVSSDPRVWKDLRVRRGETRVLTFEGGVRWGTPIGPSRAVVAAVAAAGDRTKLDLTLEVVPPAEFRAAANTLSRLLNILPGDWWLSDEDPHSLEVEFHTRPPGLFGVLLSRTITLQLGRDERSIRARLSGMWDDHDDCTTLPVDHPEQLDEFLTRCVRSWKRDGHLPIPVTAPPTRDDLPRV